MPSIWANWKWKIWRRSSAIGARRRISSRNPSSSSESMKWRRNMSNQQQMRRRKTCDVESANLLVNCFAVLSSKQESDMKHVRRFSSLRSKWTSHTSLVCLRYSPCCYVGFFLSFSVCTVCLFKYWKYVDGLPLLSLLSRSFFSLNTRALVRDRASHFIQTEISSIRSFQIWSCIESPCSLVACRQSDVLCFLRRPRSICPILALPWHLIRIMSFAITQRRPIPTNTLDRSIGGMRVLLRWASSISFGKGRDGVDSRTRVCSRRTSKRTSAIGTTSMKWRNETFVWNRRNSPNCSTSILLCSNSREFLSFPLSRTTRCLVPNATRSAVRLNSAHQPPIDPAFSPPIAFSCWLVKYRIDVQMKTSARPICHLAVCFSMYAVGGLGEGTSARSISLDRWTQGKEEKTLVAIAQLM